MTFVPQRNGSSSLVALTEDLAGCSNAPAIFVAGIRLVRVERRGFWPCGARKDSRYFSAIYIPFNHNLEE